MCSPLRVNPPTIAPTPMPMENRNSTGSKNPLMKSSQPRRYCVKFRYTSAPAPPPCGRSRVALATAIPVMAMSDHQPAGEPPDCPPDTNGREGDEIGDMDEVGRRPVLQRARATQLDTVVQRGQPGNPLERRRQVRDREERTGEQEHRHHPEPEDQREALLALRSAAEPVDRRGDAEPGQHRTAERGKR